jgi:hypothetical protein
LLPRRIYLDTSTLQKLYVFGGEIFEGVSQTISVVTGFDYRSACGRRRGVKVVRMADPFSADAFYQSACDFALSALEAHHAGNYRHVPLDAGTALEHLAKASLARRSPALLAELKNDSSIHS